MRAIILLALLPVLTLVACAGPAATGPASAGGRPGAAASTSSTDAWVQINNYISVYWGDRGPAREIDFNDPRLVRAIKQSEALLGHALELRFNVSMVPRPAERYFDSLFHRDIGRIPLDLEQAKKRDPNAFAFGAKHLERIEFDYDGALRDDDVLFLPKKKVLRVRLNSTSIPQSMIRRSFHEAYENDLRERFSDRKPASIQAAEYGDYFRWLTDIRVREKGDAQARAVPAAVTLWMATRKGPKALHDEVTEWIADRGSWFTNVYYHRREEITGPGTAWGEAERAWAQWLNAAWPSLDDKRRRALIERMYLERLGGARDADPYLRDGFPGVDVFRLSLGVVDRWIAAGHPIATRSRRTEQEDALYRWVVCPPEVQGERLFERQRCDSHFWRHAMADPKLRATLLAEILKRNDRALTEALFANLFWMKSPHLTDAWRFFETNPAQWGAASRVIAEQIIRESKNDRLYREVYDTSVRLWRARPELRGSILYILAAMDEPAGSGPVRWDQFQRVFGSLVSGKDFETYLAYGHRALQRVASVWPALDPNAGAADRLIPHLDRAMQDDAMRRELQRVAYGAMRSLMDVLRERRDRATLDRLRRYFEDRKRRYPSEEAIMDTFISMSRS